MEGTKLPNQASIITIEMKEHFKYFRNNQENTYGRKKTVPQKSNQKLLETKLFCCILIKYICRPCSNSLFLKLTAKEIKRMGQKQERPYTRLRI